MLLLYNIGIRLYYFAVRLAAFWNKKAAAWIAGRKDVFDVLKKNIHAGDAVIWVHCSSAGEFEQGKPVIEALKETYPRKKIVLTFFSPSGYAVAKNYPLADCLVFLPLDTRHYAQQFVTLVKPQLAVFVKYEFWYHHLSVAAFHHVPLLLVSAVFRKDQAFFKSYGRFFLKILHLFRHIFVQDKSSVALLQAAGVTACSISGDTRFDRVARIAERFPEIPFIKEFVGGKNAVVAGSTWADDEALLAEYSNSNAETKIIIAPHEINEAHLQQIRRLFPSAIFYSDLQKDKINLGTTANVLIVDTIGLLSRLYAYATLTYVGGGFTKDGIHNVLEAAVWSKPVFFGPNYQKYREAKELIAAGGGFSIDNSLAFKKIADGLFENKDHLQKTSLKARLYIDENTGATGKIMQTIYEKRLLTN